MDTSRTLREPVARALEVHPSNLHRWRRELQDHGDCGFSGAGKKRAEEMRWPNWNGGSASRVECSQAAELAPAKGRREPWNIAQPRLSGGSQPRATRHKPHDEEVARCLYGSSAYDD